MLSGCNWNPKDNYPYEHFNDVLKSYGNYKNVGIAEGDKAIYIYYGVEKLSPTISLYAGTAMHTDSWKLTHFPIIELLKKYPELRTKQAIKAAAAQYHILIYKKIVKPQDYNYLGHHGV